MSIPKPRPDRPNIGELLLSEGLVDETQLAVALAEQRQWGHRVGEELVRLGYLSESDLIRMLGRQLGLPIVRMGGRRVDREVLDLVPQSLAEKHRCIPLFVRQEGNTRVLQLAVEDPADVERLDELRFALGVSFKPVLVSPTDLDDALRRHYRGITEQASAELLNDADLSIEGAAPGPDRQEPKNPEAQAAAVSTAVMLRALAQLLIEKGVLDRSELVERIEQLNTESQEP